MKRYHVFLGAPSFKDLSATSKRQWIQGQTTLDISTNAAVQEQADQAMDLNEDSQIYWDQVSLIDEASLLQLEREAAEKDALALVNPRLSKLYDGVVFKDDDLDSQYTHSQSVHQTQNSNDESYEWSRSYLSQAESDASLLAEHPPVSSPVQGSQNEEYSIDEDTTYDTTRISSDTSIRRLPTFRIPMNRLRALRSLVSGGINSERNDSAKASVLVGLLDVEGPDIVRIKKGVDAGKEISLLKMMIGSPDGTVCKVTVWRELAGIWGDSLRRGDVTLLQDVLFTRQLDGSYMCTASDNLGSKATVCYRTFPMVPADRQLRPDLRLASIDPGLGRVSQIVEWINIACGITS